MTKGKRLEEYRPLVLQKMTYIRSEGLRKSAKGVCCTMGSPVCTYNPDHSALRHSNFQVHGKATGIKASDVYAFIGCNDCEAWYSMSGHLEVQGDREWYFYRAWTRTMQHWIEEGLVVVPDAK